MKIFGINALGWKIANIFVLALSTILVFLVGREMYDRRLGVIASMFFLFSHMILGFAHIGYNNLNALIPFLLSILFFVRSIRTNSPIDSLLSGLFAGFCFQRYI